MQLSEILEENSIRSISKKTNISEQNLERLLASNFANLKKVKTLGFISIIEREYSTDLTAMKEEALGYYADADADEDEDSRIMIGAPIVEEKKGTSGLFVLIILGILGYTSWYFFTQFDKKYLSELIPFMDDQTIEKFVGKSNDEIKEIFIKETTSEAVVAEVGVVQNEIASPSVTETEEVVTETAEVVESETETAQEEVAIEKKDILILPFSRLWFGLVDMGTKERNHFSINSPYILNTTEKSWLVATSSAPFSLVNGEETKDFNDAKEHYFKIDKNGIEPLTKSEYVALGGWSQW